MRKHENPEVEVLEEFSDANGLEGFEKPTLREVKVKKKNRGLYYLLCIAIAVFAVYSVAVLINQHIKISQKEQELNSLNEKISVQEIENDNIKEVYDLNDKDNKEYIEKKAREDGYLHEGERVFINISGE
ncbi:MAG: septum formation initiator family protein [Acutalibacteraceae bacterium]